MQMERSRFSALVVHKAHEPIHIANIQKRPVVEYEKDSVDCVDFIKPNFVSTVHDNANAADHVNAIFCS